MQSDLHGILPDLILPALLPRAAPATNVIAACHPCVQRMGSMPIHRWRARRLAGYPCNINREAR
jgi:hypothetical protein